MANAKSVTKTEGIIFGRLFYVKQLKTSMQQESFSVEGPSHHMGTFLPHGPVQSCSLGDPTVNRQTHRQK